MFNVRINHVIDHWCNWNDGDNLYSELETMLHREASSAVAIYCFGPQRNFISGLIDRAVIDITQLVCPKLANIILPAISCTFACHSNSQHICALRTAYSFAQWVYYYFLIPQFVKCPPQPVIIVFQMTGCFVAHTISMSKRQMYTSIYLNNDDLKPQLKTNFFGSCSVKRNTVVHSGDIQKCYTQE